MMMYILVYIEKMSRYHVCIYVLRVFIDISIYLTCLSSICPPTTHTWIAFEVIEVLCIMVPTLTNYLAFVDIGVSTPSIHATDIHCIHGSHPRSITAVKVRTANRGYPRGQDASSQSYSCSNQPHVHLYWMLESEFEVNTTWQIMPGICRDSNANCYKICGNINRKEINGFHNNPFF